MSDCRGTNSPSDGGSPPGAVQACPYASGSEILVVDELGLAVAGTAVVVTPSGGAAMNATTDATGKMCFSFPPGTSFQVQIADTHEAAAGDSVTTASGRHFQAGGTGPR